MKDRDGQPAQAACDDRRVGPQNLATVAEERMRLLIESVHDYAIFMLDPNGVVMTWNPGAENIKGYRASEIIGQHFSVFYPPEDVASGKVDHELTEAAAHGRFEDEDWRVRKDGSRFWANVVISAVRDHDGTLIGFSKVTRDLTERRRQEEALRESEQRYRMMVGSVKDYAIFTLDPSGHVQSWNPGAELIKGYTADEVIGRHFTIFYTPEDVGSGKAERELRTAEREGRFEDEGWRVRKDGTRIWSNVILSAMRDPRGELIGFVKVTRDLTDRRRAEEERVRLAQANEGIRLRDEFLSIASHELKTPLTALKLQLESLAPRIVSDPDLSGRVDRATRSAHRLHGLIESLLDVGRISTGRFSLVFDELDLSVTVHDAVERMREAAVREGCSLTVDVEAEIRASADALRVEQIISNLLSNAIRYAAGKNIRVSLRAVGAEAVLQVADDGTGIPEEKLTRIFDRFERASSLRHYGGLGLGLYIVREIAVGHGGSVEARNASGGGAVLTVRLPLDPPNRVDRGAP